jgi:hypothetical protein
MNKKQLIATLAIIMLLVMIILILANISYKLSDIDWAIRNILGKVNNST